MKKLYFGRVLRQEVAKRCALSRGGLIKPEDYR